MTIDPFSLLALAVWTGVVLALGIWVGRLTVRAERDEVVEDIYQAPDDDDDDDDDEHPAELSAADQTREREEVLNYDLGRPERPTPGERYARGERYAQRIIPILNEEFPDLEPQEIENRAVVVLQWLTGQVDEVNDDEIAQFIRANAEWIDLPTLTPVVAQANNEARNYIRMLQDELGDPDRNPVELAEMATEIIRVFRERGFRPTNRQARQFIREQWLPLLVAADRIQTPAGTGIRPSAEQLVEAAQRRVQEMQMDKRMVPQEPEPPPGPTWHERVREDDE